MNSIHDVGGMDGFGPIKPEENEPVFHEAWEGRLRAVHTLVGRKLKIYNTHESRSAMERMNPVYYLASSYYQLWLTRMETLLMERGVLTLEEIEQKEAEICPETITPHLQRYRNLLPVLPSNQRRFTLPTEGGTDQTNAPIQPKFAPGMQVRVKVMSLLGHNRAPRYVRGKLGVIEEIHGSFILPDIKVQEKRDLYQPVYRVCFDARELWGEDASPKDKLMIEMWEDYLELVG